MSTLTLINPLRSGVTTGRFGDIYQDANGNPFTHLGWDIAAPIGTPFVAPVDSVVSDFLNDGSFGPYAICLYHEPSKRYILLAHGSKSFVQAGQRVRRGEVIGLVGNMGKSSGPHLHVQVSTSNQFPRDREQNFDPESFLEEDEMSAEDKARLDRVEAILAKNGMQLIPWEDVPGEPSVLECFPPGTDATRRDDPDPDSTALWVTGEAALRYCELRGFSLGLGVGLARKELAKHARNGHGG